MTTLDTPPNPYPANISTEIHSNPPIMHVLTNLLAGHRLSRMKLELEDEIHYITHEDSEVYKPHYHCRRMYWCGHSGVHLLNMVYEPTTFPAGKKEQGLPAKLKHLYKLLPTTLQLDAVTEIHRIWQHMWSDESIAAHPSTYVNFCRDALWKMDKSPMRVRPIAIEVERARNEKRLDRALLEPKQIKRRKIMNGVGFCWQDYMGNNPQPAPSLGILTHRERAAFILCQLMGGSRFKGVAEDNVILAIYPDGILMKGLSKSKDKEKKITRPVNESLASFVYKTKTERMELFYTMMLECRLATDRIKEDRGCVTRGDTLAMRGMMRKEVRKYMNQVFPGMLKKGESTHLLRKIYLQLAFETYGDGMKETGFAARVFAHEGYATSLHYTSVIIV